MTKHTWSSSCSTQYEAVLPTSMLTEQRFYWPSVHSSLWLIVNNRKSQTSNFPVIVDVLWWNNQNSEQRNKTGWLSKFHSGANSIFFLICHKTQKEFINKLLHNRYKCAYKNSFHTLFNTFCWILCMKIES